MNVAYIALAPFISGSERSLQITITECKKEGINPILICPSSSPMHQWAEENNITSYKVDILLPEFLRFFKYFLTQVALLRIFKKHEITLVHSNQIWSVLPVQFARKLFRIPLVTHFRDPVNESSNWWLKGGVNGAITISSHIKNSVNKYVNHQLVPNTLCQINPVSRISTYTNEQLLLNRRKARELFSIKQSKFVFGYIGQVTEVKGVLELIKAFSNPSFSDDVLLIAGDDTSKSKAYINECKQLAEHNKVSDRIIWLGHIDNTKAFYEAVDTVVMLSKREPLGRVPLEAASFYTVSIVNNVDGLPETIQDKRTGWLTNAAQENDVISKMNLAKAANLSEMGVQANEFVKNIASPGGYARRVIDFYHKCIGR